LAALDAANEAHLAHQNPTLRQRLRIDPPPPLPEDPGPEPERPAPQFKRYEYSHRNPVTGITNVQPVLHYKYYAPENPQRFPDLPWVKKLYRAHAERIWAADKWREKEEDVIRSEKLSKDRGIAGKLLSPPSAAELQKVELTEEDVSPDALIRRASLHPVKVERPVLKDSHRRRQVKPGEEGAKGEVVGERIDDRRKPE
jgi:hypothetical protein